MDHYESVDGQGSGPHDQYSSVLYQLAYNEIALLTAGAKAM
jgi:hypothetical protein